MYQEDFRPQHKPAGSIQVAPVIYCDANTNALTSYSHISPPPGQFITRVQKDQGLDTDQETCRSRTGRKGPYAAYYVQISPNDSFVGE